MRCLVSWWVGTLSYLERRSCEPVTRDLRRTADITVVGRDAKRDGAPDSVRRGRDAERDGAPDSVRRRACEVSANSSDPNLTLTPCDCARRLGRASRACRVRRATIRFTIVHRLYSQSYTQFLHPHFKPGAVGQTVRELSVSSLHCTGHPPARTQTVAPSASQAARSSRFLAHAAFISVLTSRVLDATRTECILF